jgi:hypothetical protein
VPPECLPVNQSLAGNGMRAPLPLLPLLLPLGPLLAGTGDTVDQLRVGYSIVPLADQVRPLC